MATMLVSQQDWKTTDGYYTQLSAGVLLGVSHVRPVGDASLCRLCRGLAVRKPP